MKYLVCFFMLLSALQASEPANYVSENQPRTAAGQVAAYHCRIKIRTLAKKLRSFLEKTVAKSVPGFWQKIKVYRTYNPYIDNLERNAIACCQNAASEKTCTEPLVRQLELWNSEGLNTLYGK